MDPYAALVQAIVLEIERSLTDDPPPCHHCGKQAVVYHFPRSRTYCRDCLRRLHNSAQDDPFLPP